jgi:hypothetical protein
MTEANTPKLPKDINEVLQRYGWNEVRRQIDENRFTLDEALKAYPEIANKLRAEDRDNWYERVGPASNDPRNISYVSPAVGGDQEPKTNPWPKPTRASDLAAGGKRAPAREWPAGEAVCLDLSRLGWSET